MLKLSLPKLPPGDMYVEIGGDSYYLYSLKAVQEREVEILKNLESLIRRTERSTYMQCVDYLLSLADSSDYLGEGKWKENREVARSLRTAVDHLRAVSNRYAGP